MRSTLLTLILLFALPIPEPGTLTAQARQSIPPALAEMAETERAFVSRAQDVSVLQAFIEVGARRRGELARDSRPGRSSALSAFRSGRLKPSRYD